MLQWPGAYGTSELETALAWEEAAWPGSSVSEFTRRGISVGAQVRVIWPSPLEGLTGTVTFINDSTGLYEIRIDGERWRGRKPIVVARHEIELVSPDPA